MQTPFIKNCTILIQLFLLFILGIFNSCNKDNNCTEDYQVYPKLVISPENIELSPQGKGKILLSTYPATKTNWQLASNIDWLIFNPIQGMIDKDIIEIDISVDMELAEMGNNYYQIAVITNSAGSKHFFVQCDLDPEYIELFSSKEQIIIDFYDNTDEVYLINKGLVEIDWEVNNIEPYLTLNPNKGSINTGDSVLVNISVDRTDMPSGDILSNIEILSDGVDTLKIPMTIRNYFEEKWILTNNVVDATYDKINDKIIVISTDPPGVNLLNPEMQSENLISLPQNPRCLSLKPQGVHAVVGCENKIYLIDTESENIQQEYIINVDPLDVIIGSNDWCYVFYYEENHNYIKSINLNTGDTYIKQNSSYMSDNDVTVARIHPSNKYIYTLYKNGSSSKMFKYSIEYDTIFLLTEFGNLDYGVHTNFWISTEGMRLFSYNNNILRTSEDPDYDLEFITKFDLPYNNYVGWIDMHEASNLISNIIFKGYSMNRYGDQLSFYDFSTYQFIDTVNFPGYFMDLDSTGILYNSHGYYSFFNADGNEVINLIKAEDDYPLINDWSVYTCDIPGQKD